MISTAFQVVVWIFCTRVSSAVCKNEGLLDRVDRACIHTTLPQDELCHFWPGVGFHLGGLQILAVRVKCWRWAQYYSSLTLVLSDELSYGGAGTNSPGLFMSDARTDE